MNSIQYPLQRTFIRLAWFFAVLTAATSVGCGEELPSSTSAAGNPVSSDESSATVEDATTEALGDTTLQENERSLSDADVGEASPETDGSRVNTEDGTEENEEPGEGLEPTSIPYTGGGLLGRYSERGLDENEAPILTPLFQRLDAAIDFPGSDASFAEHAPTNSLTVEWEGGFYAGETGEYEFQLTAADSGSVSLHGEKRIEFAETGAYTTEKGKVLLNEGWHPIAVEYQSGNNTALAVLSVRTPGAFMQTVRSDQLGVPAIPPEEEPPLGLEAIQVEEIWAYGANISMQGTTAVKLSAEWTSFDGVKGTVPGNLDQYHSDQSVTLTLSPGVKYDVIVRIEDVWGREYQTVPLPIQTPDPGEFVLGGLYGSYYDGAEFNSLVMHRLDPQIRLPEDMDGNPNGSFATPMGGNTFSIRWTGAIWVAETGTYTLYVGGNEGYRFSLDGELLFDKWEGASGEFSQITEELSQGWHPIQLDYVEATGPASITLEWESVELGIERMPIPSENLGNSYSFENDEKDPEILTFSGQAQGATSAMFQWTASELSTAILFYRIVDGFTQEILAPEVSIPLDVPSTGWKWTIPEIEEGGELVGRVVVKDLLQNSAASNEVKFEIEGEMDN